MLEKSSGLHISIICLQKCSCIKNTCILELLPLMWILMSGIHKYFSPLLQIAVEKTLQSKLEDARQATQQRLIRSLREYRNMFAVQHRTSNRLIFPGSLELLPLYTLAINKNLALRGGYGDCTADDRSAMGFEIMTMSVSRLLKLLYPSLVRLDEYLIQVWFFSCNLF